MGFAIDLSTQAKKGKITGQSSDETNTTETAVQDGASICDMIIHVLLCAFLLSLGYILLGPSGASITSWYEGTSSGCSRAEKLNVLILQSVSNNLTETKLYTPGQLHLSLGVDPSEMYLTYSILSESLKTRVHFWDECEPDSIRVVKPEWYVWLAGNDNDEILANNMTVTKQGRQMNTYRAKMSSLSPGTRYVYYVTSTAPSGLIYYSRPYYFEAKNWSDTSRLTRVVFYGDLGLINGQSIARLTRDVDSGLYDLAIHNGDFAYDLDTQLGEYGDQFMAMIEPIAARLAYQTSVGNHEAAQKFAHYNNRFSMVDSGGLTNGLRNNFYYSFNVGSIHFVAFSSEFYYFIEAAGKEAIQDQFEWLERDLAHANKPEQRAKRPWVIVFAHRPMFCSSADHDECTRPDNVLRVGLAPDGRYALEPLFYKYGVDVELYAHEHQYERFLPIYNFNVLNGTDDNRQPYLNPRGPVHVISGSAGCQERLDPFMGTPIVGSVTRISDYGYTRLQATRCNLIFRQVSDDQAGDIVDQFVVTKTRTSNFPQLGEIIEGC